MKDYALKINGHNYDVRIDDVNESSTLAHVVVNGTAYDKLHMQRLLHPATP